jgi:hypothetical protein
MLNKNTAKSGVEPLASCSIAKKARYILCKIRFNVYRLAGEAVMKNFAVVRMLRVDFLMEVSVHLAA